MLGVTRNSVVQQHLRVVQELQLLSLVVLSYYYHEMNFGKRSIKKPTVLLVGLVRCVALPVETLSYS